MTNEKLKKYSKKEIAKKLNISYGTICRWTKGEQIEKHIEFLKLLQYLDISVDEYLNSLKKDP